MHYFIKFKKIISYYYKQCPNFLYTEITGRDLKNLKLCKILHDIFQYKEQKI